MSEIDWQADLEMKVANLLHKFKAEAESHGAELTVQVTVEVVNTPPSKSPPATQGETSTPPPKKKASKKVKKDESSDTGDDSGDD